MGATINHIRNQYYYDIILPMSAFDFATVSGFDQLVVAPTHARGGTLDLMMTDVPDLVRVAVVAPIGNSDHSSL